MFGRTNSRLTGLALGATALAAMSAASVPVRAGTVTEVVYLPAWTEQGTPDCSPIGRHTSAKEVVGAAGNAIDAGISPYTGGVPLFSGARHFPNATSWLRHRLGANEGQPACGTICVSYPGRRPGRWMVEVWDTGKPSTLKSDDREFDIGDAKLDHVSHSATGSNSVTCANIRNWNHAQKRGFKLTVNF